MRKEIPLQQDMFSGDLVDTRSSYRKRLDKQTQQLKQTEMFSARETVQLGVNSRPWLKDMAQPTLALEIQDVRTEEEKERERRRAAEALTAPMFVPDTPSVQKNIEAESEHVEPTVPALPNLRHVGYRAYARRMRVPVRTRTGHVNSKAE